MNYWKEQPTRDQVLDKAYEFIKVLAEGKPRKAEKLVLAKNFDKFRSHLQALLASFAETILEEDEFAAIPADFVAGITNPFEADEDLIFPEFTGKQLTVGPGEQLSFKVLFMEEVSNIKIHFSIYEADSLFFLKLDKLSVA